MDINTYITSLIQYALNRGLIEPCDRNYAINQLLQCLKIDTYEEAEPSVIALEDILKGLIDDAVARGVFVSPLPRGEPLQFPGRCYII